MKDRIQSIKTRVEKLKEHDQKEFCDFLEDNIKTLYESRAEQVLQSANDTAKTLVQDAMQNGNPDLLIPLENALKFVEGD